MNVFSSGLVFAVLLFSNLVTSIPQFSAIPAAPIASQNPVTTRPYTFQIYISRSTVWTPARSIQFLQIATGEASNRPRTQELPEGGWTWQGASTFHIEKAPDGGIQWGDVVNCLNAMIRYYQSTASPYGSTVDVVDGFYLVGKAYLGEPPAVAGNGTVVVPIGGAGNDSLTV